MGNHSSSPDMGSPNATVLQQFILRPIMLIVIVLSLVYPATAIAAVKNVIVLIMDGCGDEQLTLARWYKGSPLALDAIRVGAVKTYNADSVIPDSASAGTAYAAGVRTNSGVVSLSPKTTTIPPAPAHTLKTPRQPCATVLEGARLLGKSTGVVVTCRISHATPATYMAHTPSRKMDEDITEQAVYQNIDVVMGGGKKYFRPQSAGGNRQDQEDLISVLQTHGYRVIQNRTELHKLDKGKVFGLFASNHLEAEIDRLECAPEQPSLAEMTRKAIQLLSANPAGFFLLVEGSQIDWACHAHDPAHLIGDLLMFDRAVQAALDFAQKDGQTLLLALPDHNTGGMSIGNQCSDHYYTRLQPEALIAPLKKMQLSAPTLWRRVGKDKTPEKIKDTVIRYWGIQLTEKDAQEILKKAEQYGKNAHNAFGEVICPKYTDIGWTTHGHTGGDIPLFACGPHRPVGLLDAPDIGRLTAEAMDLDLNLLSARLFVEARQAFPAQAVRLDHTDPYNPVVRISYHDRQASLPVNKNLLYWGEEVLPLEGVVVYLPETETTYLPVQAIQAIKGESKPLPPITK
ncbi:alkaline phosphatase [Desulfobacca acetoxidans]|nr:alkaline phosphatase [Desulfobacca acetoxidans]